MGFLNGLSKYWKCLYFLACANTLGESYSFECSELELSSTHDPLAGLLIVVFWNSSISS